MIILLLRRTNTIFFSGLQQCYDIRSRWHELIEMSIFASGDGHKRIYPAVSAYIESSL